MVIHDLDLCRTQRGPDEADAKLIVDPNAMLAEPVAFERFQPITRRNAQIVKFPGSIQHRQLSHGHGFDAYEPPDTVAVKHPLCVTALEGPNRHM
jgi:hypothetical protein